MCIPNYFFLPVHTLIFIFIPNTMLVFWQSSLLTQNNLYLIVFGLFPLDKLETRPPGDSPN